jgi:hypothetical protein
MKTKLLFWGAILFTVLGFNAPEGNLYFFFGSYFLLPAVGRFCMIRESKRVRRAPPETSLLHDTAARHPR